MPHWSDPREIIKDAGEFCSPCFIAYVFVTSLTFRRFLRFVIPRVLFVISSHRATAVDRRQRFNIMQ